MHRLARPFADSASKMQGRLPLQLPDRPANGSTICESGFLVRLRMHVFGSLVDLNTVSQWLHGNIGGVDAAGSNLAHFGATTSC